MQRHIDRSVPQWDFLLSFLPYHIGLTLFLENDAKLFTTPIENIRPKMVIDEIRLLCMYALVKDQIVSRLEASLARSPLNFPFMTYVQKSYAIEAGRLEQHISCGLRDGNYGNDLLYWKYFKILTKS